MSLLKAFPTEPDKLSTCYCSGAVGNGGNCLGGNVPTLKELPAVGKWSQRGKPGTSALSSTSLGWKNRGREAYVGCVHLGRPGKRPDSTGPWRTVGRVVATGGPTTGHKGWDEASISVGLQGLHLSPATEA